MELKFHKAIIVNKEKRIEEVTAATRHAIKMMEHPRLMQLLHRQIEFEKQDYTEEQYFEELKRDHNIELTNKELKELALLEHTLCPQTTGELYRSIRAAERKIYKE